MNARKTRKKRRLSIHGPTPAERKWTRIIEKWLQSKLPGSAFCRKRGYPDLFPASKGRTLKPVKVSGAVYASYSRS